MFGRQRRLNAIEINSKYDTAYYNRGCAYSDLENKQQAISDYSRACEINPKYNDTQYRNDIYK
ncbi:MAG: tetratricopeptide repeat protein [Prochloron sp. SP5CPC1]|nr:tetratricopeptide repeat protein [Candidatus Paraprochloron terpiosi SP5CPC1]